MSPVVFYAFEWIENESYGYANLRKRVRSKERRDYQSQPTRYHAVIEIYLTFNIFVNVILEIK